MSELGLKANDDMAELIPINCYNMLIVRYMVEDREQEDLTLFEEVGGSKFQMKWADNTDDQRELYLALKEDLEEERGQPKEGEGASALVEVGEHVGLSGEVWCRRS